MLGKEYQQKKRQHIGKDHNQILVTAGHFHNLYNTVAPGTGQTEQETGPQGRNCLLYTSADWGGGIGCNKPISAAAGEGSCQAGMPAYRNLPFPGSKYSFFPE